MQLKPKLAILNRIFTLTGGGAERYSIALVQELAACYDIHVFAQNFEPCVPGVSYHRVSAPLRRSRWLNQIWYATASWWQTRKGFDVVHSHENVWHGQVQTVHVLPLAHTLFHGRTGLRWALRWVKVLSSPRLIAYLTLERLRLRAQSGRHVVATSNSLRDVIAAVYPALAERITVITPGVHIHAQLKDQASARQQLGLPEQGPLVLLVGNDYRKKGLETLLQAMALLPADVSLAVAGNPVQAAQFELQAKHLGVQSRVHFLGALQDVSLAYQAADCLAHPTREDTFAMVVLEAMAHGLPVVVSGAEYCGISQLLIHEDNALVLTDPRNPQQLAKYVQQALAGADALGQNARTFAKQYQWCEQARLQEALYQSM